MKAFKKALGVIIVLLIAFGMLPTNAFAISAGRVIDLAASNIDIHGSGAYWHHIGNVYYITGNGVVVTGSSSETKDKSIVINGSYTVTLESVNVTTSAGSLIRLTPGTRVTLKISESKNYLGTTHETGACIETTGAGLIIEGTGNLTVEAKGRGAGIGGIGGTNSKGAAGGNGAAGGTVSIDSGIINVKSAYGAGIGGGSGGGGSSSIAGIDGGRGGHGGSIIINGGEVTASSTSAAGIGGGRGGDGSSYTSTSTSDGSTNTTVYVGDGGDGGNGGTLKIFKGSVTASSTYGVGIGGGNGGIGGSKQKNNGKEGNSGTLSLPPMYSWRYNSSPSNPGGLGSFHNPPTPCPYPNDAKFIKIAVPIIIKTAADLDEVRNRLNMYYILSNDIDLTSYLANGGKGYAKWGTTGWEPIGTPDKQFTGEFNGDGHKITGMCINRSSTNYVGLFGNTVNALITNLGVEITAAGVKGFGTVGSVAGECISSGITNSYAKGDVSGSGVDIGGLVGCLYKNSGIENSYAMGNVNGSGSNSGSIGGLAGYQHSNSIIRNSYATGNVKGLSDTGGLVGNSINSNIENCYATGNVSGTAFVGGLTGSSVFTSNITECYATGNVNATAFVGGLVGFQHERSKVANCFVTGNVSGTSEVYGLVGFQNDKTNIISNSYRYQYSTIKGVSSTINTPDGIQGGIVTLSDLMTKTTYTGKSWRFNDSSFRGPWYWDSRGFPKLNIGTEKFPFPWNPLVQAPAQTINITTQPKANISVAVCSIFNIL